MNNRLSLLAGASTLSLVFAAPAAFAQVGDQEVADELADNIIIVTGTRRSEDLFDVPYNVSAVGGDDLEQRFITSLTDVTAAVPGLQAPTSGLRNDGTNNTFIIRGVNATTPFTSSFQQLANASVSTYIDEVPIFANLQLNDVERIEVLRGPQGTLYGASSVGGTIRIIHNEPEIGVYDYRVNASIATVKESDELDWGLDGVVNVPLGDRVAVRVSGGYNRFAGFIDATQAVVVDENYLAVLADPSDPVNSGFLTEVREDIDSAEVWYVRTSANIELSDNFDLQLVHHHQDQHVDGYSNRSVGAGPYEQRRRVVDEPSDRVLNLFSATATVDLGFATVTSATAYSDQDEDAIGDYTQVPLAFPDYYGNYPRSVLVGFQEGEVENFVHETRFVSPGDQRLRWIAGVYYQERNASAKDEELLRGYADWSELPGTGFGPFANWGDVVENYFGGVRPSSTSPQDLTYRFDRDTRFQDFALFGEVTFDITDRWQVTGGARVFWQEFEQTVITEIPGFGPLASPTGDPSSRVESSSDDSFQDQIFKVNTSYDVTDNLLAYATWSQGFRPGGGNAYAIGTCVFCDPPDFVDFRPDTADNYEIGIKGQLIPEIRFSAALFRIDWQDIQLEAGSAAGNPLIINGNAARSEGVELEAFISPARGFSISGGYAYTNPRLTEDFAFGNIGGEAGFTLPGVSKHTLSGAVDYTLPLSETSNLLFHVDGFYRSGAGDRLNEALPAFSNLEGYAMFNASVGVELNDRFSVQAFMTNITNEAGVNARSQAFGGLAPIEYAQETVQRPRTIGLRLTLQR
ncbi:MAG: TonB-dependent receptor [Pacificimonas sp.]|jgi:outer membrane receptor protein involved in Fe transport|nr:TonB-dependent receptor [Pacificimonas sp.]